MKRTAKKKVSKKSASGATVPELEAVWIQLRPAKFNAHSQTALALAKLVDMPNAQISWLRSSQSQGLEVRELLLVIDPKTHVSSARGWEAARALRQVPDVLDAEPLFLTAGLQPGRGDLAAHERKLASKSGGKDKALACAASNSIWHLSEINAHEAWLLEPAPGGQRRGKGIVVGHPDTGYTKHDEVWPKDGSPPRIKPALGYNFEEDKADPTDLMDGKSPGHGTATASVIVSSPGGSRPMFVTGAAPEAELVPFRVNNSVIHYISFKNLIQSIYRAVDMAGVHVISMSLGGPLKARALGQALDYAISKGVIVIAAAGNHYPWTVYPAGFASVIAVAASNCQHKPWSGSTNGEQVDLCAPGESVWRAYSHLKGKTLTFDVEDSSGSSYATALTAGAAATWLAYWGRDNLVARYGAAQLQAVFAGLLKKHGHKSFPDWDTKNYGVGILEMRRLLEAPLPPAAKSKVKKAVQQPSVPEIGHYFPSVPAKRVETEVSKLLGPKPTAKAMRSGSSVNHEELAFQIATNPELRGALYRKMAGPAPKSASGPAQRTRLASLLKDASDSLVSQLLAS